MANLPYNIATALLVGWLTVDPWPPWYDSLLLMFQREVAERIVAAPGGKSYGRLSVLAGWRTEARILFDVAPSAFVPPPKVTSSVVRLTPRPVPLACDSAALQRVTEAAFGQRRKMLRQSLKTLGVDTAALLAEAGIEPTARAEEIPVDGFRRSGAYFRLASRKTGCDRLHAMKMQRQSLTAYGAPLCETVIDAPRPQGSEVLVRIARCGVCHSDLHMQDGFFKLGDGKTLDVRAGRTLPFTLGHEIAGVIEGCGTGCRRQSRRASRGLSLDRLRTMRRLQGG